ncbi:MAG: hypothetical protein GC160_00870 [Acidobacteria bacterium]|nr:hypothetical protein [Acidobacteriota bacterium]
MRKKPQSRYGLLLFVGLGVTLTAQVLVYLSTIDMTIGVAPLFGRQPETPASLRQDLRVAVLNSEMSSKIDGQDPQSYFDLARKWQALLTNAGIANQLVSDHDLEKGIGVSFDVLVLPAAVCLSETQKEVILGSLEAGMGVVAGGAIGARNEQCEWQGLDFVSEFSGLRSPEVLPTGAEGYAMVRGGRFYSNQAPTGYNLPLPSQEVVVGNAADPDMYLSDRRTRPVNGPLTEGSALATSGTRGRGRYVWFGFRESIPGFSSADHEALDGYLQAAVHWTGVQPIAVLGDWPGRNTSAVVLAQNVQDNGASVRPSVAFLVENRAPATFFVTPASAEANTAALVEGGDLIEIAATDAESQPLVGQSATTQTERIQNIKAGVERALPGRTVRGFRPPQELVDQATVGALEASGLEYYYDGVAASHATPRSLAHPTQDWLYVDTHSFMRLSRAGSDDFEALVSYEGETAWGDDFVNHFLEDYDRTASLGGAYTLLFHNDLLGAPENLPALERVIRRIRQGRVWMTTAANLADWRARRSNVSVETRYVSGSRIRLAVTNRGAKPLDEATVNVYLPFRPEAVRVIPAVLRSGLPETHLLDDSDVLSLEFPSIKAQSSYVLLIALDEQL